MSKSWLHAWRTIPTLRFRVRSEQNGKSMKLVDVDHTLIRYLHDNIPIKRFGLLIDIENQESASHAEKWIGSVVTTKASCLKELSLSLYLYGAPFTFPDEILSSDENLTKIEVFSPLRRHSVVWMTTTTHVINCVSLRELELFGVRIGEEALNHIFSSCSLLETIVLIDSCKGLKTIKVKNLPCLYELTISSEYDDYDGYIALEISHVPNLGVFSCDLHISFPINDLISLGSSVTKLRLGGYGMVRSNACLKMIESGFPFLESLTLDDMTSWKSESFHFTCASIKKLSLKECLSMLTDVQVHAPKLQFFWFHGVALPPTLLFPDSTLFKKIIVSLKLNSPVDAYFFLKMREALALSRKCDIYITTYNYTTTMMPLDIDMDDLRTRLLMFPPATNVQKLEFEAIEDECLWERSPFFDAFFEICHPKHVVAKPDACLRQKNHFCRLMLRDFLEKKTTTTTTTTPYWPHHLKHVQIRRNPYEKWETLTDSHRSFLDATPGVFMHFYLNWH
ncbi:unnamed protein product [Lactuca virosa]|uniref:At1g61320/AtMIF1 LRR domain-containing protein n=1 Tax=Lactuca virosa TaxID=75947 RepID=A0AAU9P7H1_9ASTR|nr:unnamed protein product [Lactuca virosa]